MKMPPPHSRVPGTRAPWSAKSWYRLVGRRAGRCRRARTRVATQPRVQGTGSPSHHRPPPGTTPRASPDCPSSSPRSTHSMPSSLRILCRRTPACRVFHDGLLVRPSRSPLGRSASPCSTRPAIATICFGAARSTSSFIFFFRAGGAVPGWRGHSRSSSRSGPA